MQELKRISTYKDFLGELSVTYKRSSLKTFKIGGSDDAAKFIRPYFEECMDNHEEFKVMHLNNRNMVVNVHHMSSGGTAGTLIDTKLILQQALLIKTSSLICVHNHPSGELNPSQADIQTSNKLREACKLVDLKLLDSLIITREGYYSLADNLVL